MTKERLRELHNEAQRTCAQYFADPRLLGKRRDEWKAAEAAFQAALDEAEIR